VLEWLVWTLESAMLEAARGQMGVKEDGLQEGGGLAESRAKELTRLRCFNPPSLDGPPIGNDHIGIGVVVRLNLH
jgi:hypothetical protein